MAAAGPNPSWSGHSRRDSSTCSGANSSTCSGATTARRPARPRPVRSRAPRPRVCARPRRAPRARAAQHTRGTTSPRRPCPRRRGRRPTQRGRLAGGGGIPASCGPPARSAPPSRARGRPHIQRDGTRADVAGQKEKRFPATAASWASRPPPPPPLRAGHIATLSFSRPPARTNAAAGALLGSSAALSITMIARCWGTWATRVRRLAAAAAVLKAQHGAAPLPSHKAGQGHR
jgi:hypothetical protein